MKLRQTTILVVMITFLLLTLVLSISLQSVINNYFKNEEKQVNAVNLQRVMASFENNFTILNFLANDWSHREDTYQFVQDGNIEFIRSNLTKESFRELGVNFIIVQDLEGNMVYAGAYDQKTQEIGEMSPEINKYLEIGQEIVNVKSFYENKQGVVMLNDNPLLLVASSIHTSNLNDPFLGVFILGKYFGTDEVQVLAQQVQFPIQVDFYQPDLVSEDFNLARNHFSTSGENFYSLVLSESVLGGYLLIRDVDNQPAFIIRIEQFRNIAKNADFAMRFVYLAMITSALVFGILFFVVIEKIVLSRLLRLNKEVQSIASNPQKIQTVTVAQKDEISSLSKNINLMLESLKTAEQQRAQAEQQLRLMVESVDDTIFTISKDLNDVRVFGGQPELLGFDPAPAEDGNYFLKSFSTDWKTSHVQPMMRALTGEHIVYEWKNTQMGEEEYFQISMSPLYGHPDEITDIVGVARNITKLKKMDFELRQKFEELSALYAVSRLYLTQIPLREIQVEICRLVIRHFGAEFAWIGSVSYLPQPVHPVVSANILLDQIDTSHLPAAMLSGDFSATQLEVVELGSDDFSKSDIGKFQTTVPLRWEGSQGMILCYQTGKDPRSSSSLQFLQSFCNMAELVLANATLFEEVKESRMRLRDLSRQLVQVHEEERRWLARELHDEIGQYLTALKLQLGQSETNNGKNDLFVGRAQKLVDELIQKVRQMSLDLRPSILDDLGLLPAFEWFFDRYQTQTGINVLFHQEGLNRKRFAPELEITAFRVVQEALTNVARHAKTPGVKIQLKVTDTQICLDIEDSGIGFKMAPGWMNKSSGIMGMMERVNLISGKFEIHSESGEGTSIHLQLPINMELRNDDKNYNCG